ncbi:MAG: hypothetical protein KAS32_07835 [Candidatus Peribacteraceae bacterium]|nr:hypothetical protein [Candidatus Peribacteraceae bacterium]
MPKALEINTNNQLSPAIATGVEGVRKSIEILGTVLTEILKGGEQILPEVAKQGTSVVGGTLKAILRTIRAPINVILGDREK